MSLLFRMTSLTDLDSLSPTESPVQLRWRSPVHERRAAKKKKKTVRRAPEVDKSRRYLRGKRLQEPHLSEVRLGRDTCHDGRRVVIKEPFRPGMIKAEIAALTRIAGHRSIVTLLDFFCDRGSTFLVFKFVKGLDLIDWLNDFFADERPAEAVEAAMRPVARQIAAALLHCHAHGVAHRDVKPENVRIHARTQRVTLIDFGLSYVTDAHLDPQARVGSLDYAAPELRTLDAAVDPFKCDVWSLGVLVHAMTHHWLPFVRGQPDTRAPPSAAFTRALRDTIDALLTEDSAARPDMKAVTTSLPWMQKPASEDDDDDDNGACLFE